MPGLTFLLLEPDKNNLEEEEKSDSTIIEFYESQVIPLYDKLAKDQSEIVRGSAALVLHEVKFYYQTL